MGQIFDKLDFSSKLIHKKLSVELYFVDSMLLMRNKGITTNTRSSNHFHIQPQLNTIFEN